MDDGRQLDRRQFLLWMSAAAGLIAAHDSRSTAASGAPVPKGRGTVTYEPRIVSLELQTSAPMEAMKAFYADRLGLKAAQTADRLVISAGTSEIAFVRSSGEPAPFYHFAFNIPENKIRAALDWQRARTPLIPIPDHLRDPVYPPEVVDYRHWNAHSIFFLDPGGNVVEYIARHDLPNAAPGPFGPADILYASEIAFVVDDVATTAASIRGAFDLPQYRGGDDRFLAVGDERGLLLVMKRGRILNFNPQSDEKAARVYPTQARVRSEHPRNLNLAGFPYRIDGE